ncbi:MAG: sulfotransferase domain-containing protein [Porticoccaceae bacterium]
MARPGFSFANDGRKKLAVISHERSGTHFLMNTVANHFGYMSKPWWNFDFDSMTINFHAPVSIQKYFQQFHDKSIINILKSHHPATFFDGILDYITDQFHVLYIYRDPRDALISNWKLIRSFSWDEGPKPETAAEFIRAEPRGGMMRYQKTQERSMLHRWQSNVKSWLDAAEQNPSLPICVLKYEELNDNFEKTLRQIEQFTGISCGQIEKPKVNENVIGSGEGKSGGYKKYLNSEDLEFIDKEIGDFMRTLGYHND